MLLLLLFATILLASPVTCTADASGSLIKHADEHYRNYNSKQQQHQQHLPALQHAQQRHPASSLLSGHYPYQQQQQQLMSMNNLTASVGRNGTFECVFPDLTHNFRLAWFHRDKHRLLALHDSVIVKNGRISVRSHGNTTFYLTIHDIRYEDRGAYECQVNSVPMRKRIGFLEVNVPPSFKEELTSSDVDISEGSSVSLRCSAHGRPPPEISWRREDGQAIEVFDDSGSKPSTVLKGDFLNINNASRTHSGAYLCIASNGIPSPISKRIFLGVTFSPVIWSNKEELGVYTDASVVLQCHLEAYPRPSYYWLKDDHLPPIIHSDKKYEISLLEGNTSYRFILRLQIFKVLKSDFGKYSCVVMANNGAGGGSNGIAGGGGTESKASLRLYEIQRKNYPPKPKPTPPRSHLKSRPFFDLFQTSTKSPLLTAALVTSSSTSLEEQKRRSSVGKVLDAYSLNEPSSTRTEVTLDYVNSFTVPGDEDEGEGTSENKANNMQQSSRWHIFLFLLPFFCL